MPSLNITIAKALNFKYSSLKAFFNTSFNFSLLVPFNLKNPIIVDFNNSKFKYTNISSSLDISLVSIIKLLKTFIYNNYTKELLLPLRYIIDLL